MPINDISDVFGQKTPTGYHPEEYVSILYSVILILTMMMLYSPRSRKLHLILLECCEKFLEKSYFQFMQSLKLEFRRGAAKLSKQQKT